MAADAHRRYLRLSLHLILDQCTGFRATAEPAAWADPRTTWEGRLPEDDQWFGRQPGPEERGQGGGQRRPYPVSISGRRTSYGFRNNTAGRRGTVVPPALLEGDRRRGWSEFIMPASVILAGVLIVVAFGFIINRATRSDDTATPPAVQPPALGQFSAAPTDQGAIPLPTAASESPSPSPSKTTPTTKPPRSTAPADTGSITIKRSGVGAVVNLSAEGTRDWVHWGEESTFSLERDKDGGFAILEGAPTAPRFRHALSPQRFSWTGGSPVDHSDGTPTGIRTCGKGNGFTLSAPAAKTTRTLRIYVGVLAGRGRLDAKLSTGGATKSARFEQQGATLSTAVFTVTYRAPKDGTLKLNWVTEDSFNSDCGGVALEAATLR